MLPYTFNTQTTVVSATPKFIVAKAPYRGAVTRLIVKQVSGSLEGFTVDLYDDNPEDTTDGLDADVHKVIDTMTADAASSTVLTFEVVSPYVNKEVDSTDAALRPQSRLYIEINASGTGSKNFDISLTTTAQF